MATFDGFDELLAVMAADERPLRLEVTPGHPHGYGNITAGVLEGADWQFMAMTELATATGRPVEVAKFLVACVDRTPQF